MSSSKGSLIRELRKRRESHISQLFSTRGHCWLIFDSCFQLMEATRELFGAYLFDVICWFWYWLLIKEFFFLKKALFLGICKWFPVVKADLISLPQFPIFHAILVHVRTYVSFVLQLLLLLMQWNQFIPWE